MILKFCGVRCSAAWSAARRLRDHRHSDVVLSMEMVSLPIGGMMTRMACGRTMRRIVRPRDMPSDERGLGLAAVHRDDAGAHQLGRVGGLVESQGQDGRHDQRRSRAARLEPSRRRCR